MVGSRVLYQVDTGHIWPSHFKDGPASREHKEDEWARAGQSKWARAVDWYVVSIHHDNEIIRA